MTLTAISLFSGGVDGIGIAFEQSGLTVTHYVEQDAWCCMNLRRLHPDATVIEGDIKDVDANRFPAVDVIFGGPPCQPHSLAGGRRGAADERHLWPEMLRLVSALRPRFVLVENVPGLLSNGVLEEICDDLEREQYAVWPLVYPTVVVGTPHIRERVFIVAYTASVRRQRHPAKPGRAGACKNNGWVRELAGVCTPMGNSGLAGLQKRHTTAVSILPRHIAGRPAAPGRNRATQPGLGRTAHGRAGRVDRHYSPSAFPGFPAGQGGFQYDYEPPRTAAQTDRYRKNRIAALGNAVVWQQVYPIAAAIARWITESLVS